MRRLHDAIEDGISQGWIVQLFMPAGNGKLTGDQCRASADAIVLSNAPISFDKFHVVWHASFAVDKIAPYRAAHRPFPEGHPLVSLLKDRSCLTPEAAADLDALIARMTTVRTARAWSAPPRP